MRTRSDICCPRFFTEYRTVLGVGTAYVIDRLDGNEVQAYYEADGSDYRVKAEAHAVRLNEEIQPCR